LIKEGTFENAKRKDVENEEGETKCICMDLGFEVLGIQQPKWMTNVQVKEKIKCRTNNQLG